MNIFDLIKQRRTVRKFKIMRLDKAQIEKYIDAARLAPSAMNMQPIKYAAVLSTEKVEEIFPLTRWAGYVPEYNPTKSEIPAAFVAVCIDGSLKSNYSEFDMGAAIENMILAALGDGVGACVLGAIDKPKITEILELPQNLSLCYLVALGYSAEKQTEVPMKDGNIKYYIERDTVCVPKRSLEEVLIKTI